MSWLRLGWWCWEHPNCTQYFTWFESGKKNAFDLHNSFQFSGPLNIQRSQKEQNTCPFLRSLIRDSSYKIMMSQYFDIEKGNVCPFIIIIILWELKHMILPTWLPKIISWKVQPFFFSFFLLSPFVCHFFSLHSLFLYMFFSMDAYINTENTNLWN